MVDHGASRFPDPHHTMVDHGASRYPASIVWTPIHPITAFCPYVGHIGVCSSDGVTHDWVGMVNVDNMAFGSPTRYMQLGVSSVDGGEEEWDRKLDETVHTFNWGPLYNFVTYNCHSFVLHFLNSLPPAKGRAVARQWSLVTLCATVFFTGRFTSVCGFLSTVLPVLILYAIAWCAAGLAGVATAFRIALWMNAAFIAWFCLATACGVKGMYGRWDSRRQDADAPLQQVPQEA